MLRTILIAAIVFALVVSPLAVTPLAAQRRGGGGRRASEAAASGTAAVPAILDTVPELWKLEGRPAIDLSPTLGTSLPPVPAKVVRYVEAFLLKHDANGDGRLQRDEWAGLSGAPQAIDVDGDLELSLEELVRYVATTGRGRTIHRPQLIAAATPTATVPAVRPKLFQPISAPAVAPLTESAPDAVAETDVAADTVETATDLSPEEILAAEQQVPAERRYTGSDTSVPAWFILRDKNGDGQISIIEFAPSLSHTSLALFGRLDANGDGFITPNETRPTGQ
ncbi:MAG: hypothetical protein ACRC46_09025 [Thermoguttaceae bacterium]